MAPPAAEAVQEELLKLYRDASRHIDERLAALLGDPAEAQRQRRLRARLVDLSREVTGLADNLDTRARRWTGVRYPTIYGHGAQDAAAQTGGHFRWTQPDVAAVTELAHDTYADLLAATRFVRRDAKALIRELSRAQARVALLEGETARRSGEMLARQLDEHGIKAVRYNNGARHSLGDYADTVLRSKTAVAYNAGLLNTLDGSGVGWVEVFDGPDCGWTSHQDSDLANGTVRSVADAVAHSIAHPRCARSFGARTDVTNQTQAQRARQFTPEEQQAMAATERARADAQTTTRQRTARQQRTRDRRTARVTRRGV